MVTPSKTFFVGILCGAWIGFAWATYVLDKFYRDVLKKVIDQIHKQYQKGH